MASLATSQVHAAVNRAAAQLLEAAGPDGIVSRKDIRTRLLSLEGVERELVDALYRFISSRDSARSTRMTKSAIDSALGYVIHQRSVETFVKARSFPVRCARAARASEPSWRVVALLLAADRTARFAVPLV